MIVNKYNKIIKSLIHDSKAFIILILFFPLNNKLLCEFSLCEWSLQGCIVLFVVRNCCSLFMNLKNKEFLCKSLVKLFSHKLLLWIQCDSLRENCFTNDLLWNLLLVFHDWCPVWIDLYCQLENRKRWRSVISEHWWVLMNHVI